MLLSLRLKVAQISVIIALGAILGLIPWAVNHHALTNTKKQQDSQQDLLENEVRPFEHCEGPCSDDGDCQLRCSKPSSDERVLRSGDSKRESSHVDIFSTDSLATQGDPTVETMLTLLEDNELDGPLGMCQGDCDSDEDCHFGLKCFKRDDDEAVPGCFGRGENGKDYCYGGHGQCQGDCYDDDDCQPGLKCFQRQDSELVPGCLMELEDDTDYCYTPPAGTLVKVGKDRMPAKFYPLGPCQGECYSDNDCAGALRCFHRSEDEAFPGCSGDGASGVNYCLANAPAPGKVTYQPGNLVVHQHGIVLSAGLLARVIATQESPVHFDTGGESSAAFHGDPDGAAVFTKNGTDGWVYVSNSEKRDEGGVGAVYFNSKGQVTGYERILSGTKNNCGGGKTPWKTWITCEEHDEGKVWHVDPWGQWSHVTIVGDVGANYESAAYDNRDPQDPRIFVTIDEDDGPLLRFTPDPSALSHALSTGDYTRLLNTTGPGAKWEYLVLNYDTDTRGTFAWTTDIDEGRDCAGNHFSGLEGLDVYDGMLYMTAKEDKHLFMLDLDNMTFTQTSTEKGAFDSEPDQIKRLLDRDGSILYFCEDGDEGSGVHGRDLNGNYFTILKGDSDSDTNGGVEMKDETSGLSFSPDKMFMYVAFQAEGKLFEVRRADGLPFNGRRLDIKYNRVDKLFEED